MEGMRNRVWQLAIVALIAGAAIAVSPKMAMAPRKQDFYVEKVPSSFGDYSVVHVVPTSPEDDPTTWEVLQPDGIVERTFRDSKGALIDFLVLAGRSSNSFHDPQICFRNQGWQLQSPRFRHIRVESLSREIEVNYMPMKDKNGNEATAIYFFHSPVGFTAKPLTINMSLFLAKTLGISLGEGFFYRYILIKSTGDQEADVKLLTDFISASLAGLKKTLPDAVGG